MDTKQISPTPVKLSKDDKQALDLIKRFFSRSGAQLNTSSAIRVAIHDTAQRLLKNEKKDLVKN